MMTMELIIKAKKWKINLAVIGGYAVQAYTKAYRFTKDIDLVLHALKLGVPLT